MESFQFLLDTNIVSHLVRHPQGIVRDRIAEIGQQTVPALSRLRPALPVLLSRVLARGSASPMARGESGPATDGVGAAESRRPAAGLPEAPEGGGSRGSHWCTRHDGRRARAGEQKGSWGRHA
jgi:hypothetical protein